MTSNDLETHINEFKIKFPIDLYTYHMHLVIFSIFDPKMTFFDPLGDLEWPRDAHHWIQKKISNRSICISYAFGHISEFWPQNDLFWPLRWPRMTSRCTPLNSEENFQSIYMHIMHIWPEIKVMVILWPLMTLNASLWPFDPIKRPNQTQIRNPETILHNYLSLEFSISHFWI